jgi:hypothetical protein
MVFPVVLLVFDFEEFLETGDKASFVCQVALKCPCDAGRMKALDEIHSTPDTHPVPSQVFSALW